MSDSSKDAARSLELLPPRSLMNLEDAEEIWTIITKRYPKAAPLLCEMESVLDHAENLLEQLKSPSDLGIVLSTEDSFHGEESEETVSDQTNLCEKSVLKDIEFGTPSFWETQEYNIDYETAVENNQVPFIEEDPVSLNYTLEERDSLLDEVRDGREEISIKSEPQCSEGFTQKVLSNNFKKTPVKNNKGSRSSSASKVLGNPVPRLLQSPRRQKTHSEEIKSPEKTVSNLKGSPRKGSNKAEVSIPHFKKVVETIRLKEESSQNVKKAESIKTDVEPQEKLEEIAEIIRIKQKNSASIDGWDKVVSNSSKSCETSLDQKTSHDETTSSPGCDDEQISMSSFSESCEKKKKTCEDLCKKHHQKLKNQLKDH